MMLKPKVLWSLDFILFAVESTLTYYFLDRTDIIQFVC